MPPNHVKLSSTVSLLAVVAATSRWNYAASEKSPQKFRSGEKVVLAGDLKRISAYGPPNFGETPETDKKETYIVLTGFSSFTIVEAAGDNSNPISRTQLIFEEKNRSAKGKADVLMERAQVEVSGVIFSASTGHHHEPAILIVDDLRAIEVKK